MTFAERYLKIIGFEVLVIFGSFLLLRQAAGDFAFNFYWRSIFSVGGFNLGIGCALLALFAI
jgi:hypothetical protein